MRNGLQSEKLLLRLRDRPVVAWAVLALDGCPLVESITVIASEHNLEELARVLGELPTTHPLELILGGPRRQDSVARAVHHLAKSSPELVVVHDGARPLVSSELLCKVIEAGEEHGAATAALCLRNACKEVDDVGFVKRSIERSSLVSVQTPQAFRFDILKRAHEEGGRTGAVVDDDAELVERLGLPVRVVDGEYRNIKITTGDDLVLLEAHVSTMAAEAG